VKLAEHLKARYALGQLGLPTTFTLVGLVLTGTLIIPLTGYLKGNGAGAVTASATIPNTDITGLGTASTHATGDFLQVANNLSDITNAGTARTNLGLGTAATHATGDFAQTANNLSDLANAGTARTNLGLGTMATQAASAVAITGGTIKGITLLLVNTSTDDGVNALQVAGSAKVTKASAGDAITFTNGGSTPKTGYLYTDASVVGFFSGASGANAGLTLGASALTMYGPNQSKTLVLDNTGVAVTGLLTGSGNVGLANTFNVYWGSTTCAISGTDSANTITFFTGNASRLVIGNSSFAVSTPGSFAGDLTLTSSGDIYARVVRSTVGLLGDAGGSAGFQIRVKASGVEGLDITNLAANVTYFTLTSTGINATAIGATTASTAKFTTVAASSTIKSTAGDVRAILDGSDTAASGAFLLLSNAAENRIWLHQLTASNNMDLWYFNGTSYARQATFYNSGNACFGANVDSSRVRAEVTSGSGLAMEAVNLTAAATTITAWNKDTTNNNKFMEFYTETSIATLRGSIDYNRGVATRFNTSSDGRLKKLIGDASPDISRAILLGTRIREYEWLEFAGKRHVGVIAQEVLASGFTGAVSHANGTDDEPGYMGVDKTAWNFHLIAGWQDHDRKIESHEARLAKLEARA
jgi:hypothetical protein